jgi:hypothetical protein
MATTVITGRDITLTIASTGYDAFKLLARFSRTRQLFRPIRHSMEKLTSTSMINGL